MLTLQGRVVYSNNQLHPMINLPPAEGVAVSVLRFSHREGNELEFRFAQSLRALRQKSGLNLSEVARRSGVSRRALTNWEAGAAQPRLPELHAALNALAATPEEAASLLDLLDSPRGLRLAEEKRTLALPEGFAGAGVGDLLRAMRMRRYLTQDQMAAQLRIHRQSVLRWEAGQTRISSENLERVCVLLGAAPEERQALQAHRLTMPGWEAGDWQRLGVEEAAHLWRELQRPHHNMAPDYRPHSPLFELQALAMKRHLYSHARRGADIRSLLAHLETDHALWLHDQNRATEARAPLFRALRLVQEETVPQDFWGGMFNLAACAGYLAPASHGQLTSLRVMAKWLPRLPPGLVRTQQLCDMALYTGLLHDKSKALLLLEQAARSLDRAGTVSADETYYHAVTLERVNLIARSTLAISDGLLAQCPNDFQRIQVSLHWMQTLKFYGETRAASRYVSQARAMLTPETPTRLRQLVADYSLQA